jgi:hypothetical protein
MRQVSYRKAVLAGNKYRVKNAEMLNLLNKNKINMESEKKMYICNLETCPHFNVEGLIII